MSCPKGHEHLQDASGMYDTGVVAPDGYRESVWEEGLYCEACDRIYDPRDIEDEGEN